MSKILIGLILCFLANLMSNISFASSCDSAFILVVDPVAEIRWVKPDEYDPVDVKIQEYAYRFPQLLYECIANKKNFDLRTRFDELIRLKEQIESDNRKEFIAGTLKLLPYRPCAYLFTSIYKETEKVVLHAEIIDLSAKPSKVESCRIRFTDFLDDDYVRRKIKVLADKIGNSSEPSWGMSFGLTYQYGGDQVTLYNVPADIRTIPPHSDDILNRPGDILDTTISDNYLVRENIIKFELGHRQTLELGVSILKGIVSIAIRTTAIERIERGFNQNQFRKAYIDPVPGDPFEGSAFIYYIIEAEERDFLDKNSFSIPVYVAYPIICIGGNQEILLRAVAGTNVLLPETIELVSEQGWDRYGALEIQHKKKLGKFKNLSLFYGIRIDGTVMEKLKLGFEFTLVHTDYRKDFSIPLSVDLDRNIRPAFKIYCTALLGK